MPHEWGKLDDEVVAAAAICPNRECGALVIAFRETYVVRREDVQPWEFACLRCGNDFAVPEDELVFRSASVPKGWLFGRDSSRVTTSSLC
jgi:ribosomal protein S27AE